VLVLRIVCVISNVLPKSKLYSPSLLNTASLSGAVNSLKARGSARGGNSAAYGSQHVVRQDNKLRWPAVVMGAKAHDVDLSHSGRKIARNLGESKRGVGFTLGPPLCVSNFRLALADFAVMFSFSGKG
jgi:hypothetical protein